MVPVSNGKVPGNSLKKDAGIPVADYDQYLESLARGEAATLPETVEPSPRAVGAAPRPVISSVDPNIGPAGTGTEITITGTGFGLNTIWFPGDVAFLYRYKGQDEWGRPVWFPIWASGGGDDRNVDNIVSWSDTQIVVRVPVGVTSDNYPGSASSGFVYVSSAFGGTSQVVTLHGPLRVLGREMERTGPVLGQLRSRAGHIWCGH